MLLGVMALLVWAAWVQMEEPISVTCTELWRGQRKSASREKEAA